MLTEIGTVFAGFILRIGIPLLTLIVIGALVERAYRGERNTDHR